MEDPQWQCCQGADRRSLGQQSRHLDHWIQARDCHLVQAQDTGTQLHWVGVAVVLLEVAVQEQVDVLEEAAGVVEVVDVLEDAVAGWLAQSQHTIEGQVQWVLVGPVLILDPHYCK